jgi:hypothetical protein
MSRRSVKKVSRKKSKRSVKRVSRKLSKKRSAKRISRKKSAKRSAKRVSRKKSKKRSAKRVSRKKSAKRSAKRVSRKKSTKRSYKKNTKRVLKNSPISIANYQQNNSDTSVATNPSSIVSTNANNSVHTKTNTKFKSKGGRKKPVIYLYPTEVTNVTVELDLQDTKLTSVYPKGNYQTENKIKWDVIANPDGNINLNNEDYSYLFWESTHKNSISKNKFIVPVDSFAIEFNELLKVLGLTTRDRQDFVTYWLNDIEVDKRGNNISIEIIPMKDFNEMAKLTITPKPDFLMRVFAKFKFEEDNVQLRIPSKMKLSVNDLGFEDSYDKKHGFTVLEWGATLLN